MTFQQKGKRCVQVRQPKSYFGKQGLTYYPGISIKTVKSKDLCMLKLIIPPGVRAVAHLHENHETAIYMIEGIVDTWWGNNLEHHLVSYPGDYFYIPANVPHLPWNRQEDQAIAIISRTDPNEQESVVVLDELDRKFQKRKGIKSS